MKRRCTTFTRVYCTLTAMMLMVTLTTGASEPKKKVPQWLSKGEAYLNAQRTNDTYYFKIIKNVGSDISFLRQGNSNALADYIGKRNKLQGMEVMEIENTQAQSGVTTRESYQMAFKNEFSSDVFYATLVDEYWESVESNNGHHFQYYALYAVSVSGSSQPMYDHFEVSRNYGATPALLSVIPGAGQLYKGQKTKGFLMLGGAALGTAAIIYSANRCSYYETRIMEQPKFARNYSKKRDDLTTWRNIAIGATGALVVWSVIDAAVTPGATRIKISPATSFRIHPTAMSTSDDIGLGLSLAFTF